MTTENLPGERGGVSPPVLRQMHRGADAAPLANVSILAACELTPSGSPASVNFELPFASVRLMLLDRHVVERHRIGVAVSQPWHQRVCELSLKNSRFLGESRDFAVCFKTLT